jgi:hypothetical protein
VKAAPLVLVLALSFGRAGLAAPQGERGRDIPFPANATSQAAVQRWIDRNLPAKGYVVGAWSRNVVMLVSTTDLNIDNYPEVSAQVWTEVTNPRAAQAAGWRADIALQVFACDLNQYRTASSLLFARADRRGAFETHQGDGVWQVPGPGTTMETVERAACFYGRKRRAAMAPAKPPLHKPTAKPAPASSASRRTQP